jgi:putative transposase
VIDTNVIKLAQPGTFTDSLTEILRNGARALLVQAVEMEVADFLGRYADLKTKAGHQRVVRHGHLPEREIMTGIGSVAVRQPRVRDREAVGSERIRFSPTILPPYARRTKSLEVLFPILFDAQNSRRLPTPRRQSDFELSPNLGDGRGQAAAV